jgi:hypothetical protein
MKRAVIALSAAALAIGTATVPDPADALAEWVIPVIIASGVGGTILGAGAASEAERRADARPPAVAYYPAPTVAAPARVYAAPVPSCWITKAQRPDGRFIDVRVCDPR